MLTPSTLTGRRPGATRLPLSSHPFAVLATALLLLAARPVGAQDYSETLGPAVDLTVAEGTHMVSAGAGLYGDGAGTITLNIPAGVTVKQVLLYWAGRAFEGDRDPTLIVDGTEVTGRLVGISGAPPVAHQGFTYRADVTGLGLIAPGSNVVELSGFEDPNITHSNAADAFRTDGASIVVVYDDGVSDESELSIYDGADLAWRNSNGAPNTKETVRQTFSFSPMSEERTATLSLLIADTQPDRPERLTIWVDGAIVYDQFNTFQALSGAQWSDRAFPVVVPAGATGVSVQLFSESPNGPTADNPESLQWIFAGFALPLPAEEIAGCTRTQGYWKTHSERGPAPTDPTWARLGGADTGFFDTRATWYTVFHTPPRGGNAYIQLAHQYMAAYLNGLAGASDAAVAAELAEAAGLLDEHDRQWDNPRALKRSEPGDFARMGQLAGILDDYNNGLIGPGHCDAVGTEAAGPQFFSLTTDEVVAGVVAYPNPLRDQATVEVSLAEQAVVHAAVYDVTGRQVALLADGLLGAGTHRLPFDASALAAGVYVYRVETPTGVETGRLSVLR